MQPIMQLMTRILHNPVTSVALTSSINSCFELWSLQILSHFLSLYLSNDESWMIKVEWWKLKDEGWKDWFLAVWGFWFMTDERTDERTDICDCRVAFATENFLLQMDTIPCPETASNPMYSPIINKRIFILFSLTLNKSHPTPSIYPEHAFTGVSFTIIFQL